MGTSSEVAPFRALISIAYIEYVLELFSGAIPSLGPKVALESGHANEDTKRKCHSAAHDRKVGVQIGFFSL
jgi:hypothetical protein